MLQKQKLSQVIELFRELKSTPVWYNKNVYWFFLYVCNPKFAAFWCFAMGQHVNGWFFANTDVFSIGMHSSSLT